MDDDNSVSFGVRVPTSVTNNSPRCRAGLLQATSPSRWVPLSQDSIRQTTLEFSLRNSPAPAMLPSRRSSRDSFIFPTQSEPRAVSSQLSLRSESSSELLGSRTTTAPSNLSILLATRSQSLNDTEEDTDRDESEDDPTVADQTPRPLTSIPLPTTTLLSERTPLLPLSSLRPEPCPLHARSPLQLRKLTGAIHGAPSAALKALPAVMLGSLLNILDAVSYGMIIFPTSGIFTGLGPTGVSMFFVSAIISQLVFTLGGSGFAGANGSMMIEVVPFFHILANDISDRVSDPKAAIATTLVAFALSSVLTGLAFFLLGALKLGNLIGFFPRHILVGCIGGVGVFLLETGLAVSLRIPDDAIDRDPYGTFSMMFTNGSKAALWLTPLGLAIALRLITTRITHQLVFPLYFLAIPIIFYFAVLVGRMDLGSLRSAGWLFDIGDSSNGPWYQFYTYYSTDLIHFTPLWETLPTQFALLFFNILHPPLNVPALSVSLEVNVDTNKELVGHGYSNLLSGLLGTVPNYLVYVNTLLFYRVGGTTRIAGFLLACVTVILLLVGTGPIAYIPVMVVGALIFVLGFDLIKEALWDTRRRVDRSEYVTIVCIMVCMTVWDFVVGVLFGIVVSCIFFVVQNSQRRSVHSQYTGESTLSTVRRPPPQRAYLRDVARQTTILRLQGPLFFGTIAQVEYAVQGALSLPSWDHRPVRFLVLDFARVTAVDMSAGEALGRIHCSLVERGSTLVICATSPDVAHALQAADVLGADHVEYCETLGDAMEWTENAYLASWFMMARKEHTAVSTPIQTGFERRNGVNLEVGAGSFDGEWWTGSPRKTHMYEAGYKTIANYSTLTGDTGPAQPLATLLMAFSPSYTPAQLLPHLGEMGTYLEQVTYPVGHILWKQGSAADALYLVQAGTLRASYLFADHMPKTAESMVPGTLAGELSFLSGEPRNATVVVEQGPAILWKLDLNGLARMEDEKPQLARGFTRLALKAAKIDYDILLSALATRQ